MKSILLILIAVASIGAQNVIDSVLDSEKRHFSNYYQIAKMKNPGLDGFIIYKIKLDSGRVAKADVLIETTYDEKLISKITRRLSLLKFNSIDTVFNYRIIFD